MLVETYKNRPDYWRILETVAGFLMLSAGIAGNLLFEMGTVTTLLFVSLGGVFISKTKTLELLDKIKTSLPGG